MILILGGTTEGRKAVQVVESAGKPYYYSTVGNEQAIEAVHAIRLTGGMDEEKMAQFCREKKISLLVDAAHPFAHPIASDAAKVPPVSGFRSSGWKGNTPHMTSG